MGFRGSVRNRKGPMGSIDAKSINGLSSRELGKTGRVIGNSKMQGLDYYHVSL
jgi:hypothetical protein